MPVLIPTPGLIIPYAYLWRYEYKNGMEEGRKARPCVVVLAVEKTDDTVMVTVLPVTHSSPKEDRKAIEIPLRVKQHLHLDAEKLWVIIDEANQFKWPGYDIRPVPGSKNRFEYGFLPPKLFDHIKNELVVLYHNSRLTITPRD